ncbi:MAG: class I SAM-dependent methyltransferase [Candidatus Bathyarchaeia archaeon]
MASLGAAPRMSQFGKTYFTNRKYFMKEEQVKQHVFKVIDWASDVSGIDLSDGKGRLALDVGCASGLTSKALTKLGYRTCGIDVSSWAVRQARKTNAGDFLTCDVQAALPFREGSFSLVACFDVLEHLPHPERALRNMIKLCNGTLLCTTPNKLMEKPVRALTRDLDETHISVKSPGEWRNVVNSNLSYSLFKLESFFDITAQLTDRFMFRSIRLPKVGLTIRMVIRK